jgi:hypothetical protein
MYENREHVYGLMYTLNNGNCTEVFYRSTNALGQIGMKKLIRKIATDMGVGTTRVRKALHLFVNDDGSPCSWADMYEDKGVVENTVSMDEVIANLAAEVECD